MAKEKLSITIHAELAREARQLAGPRGLSRLVNVALEQYLQAARLWQLEADPSTEYGPITEEAQRQAAAIPWPK